MLFPRARLVVSACLFVGWLAFLFFLVMQNQHMIVVSRPQLFSAPLCVIAEVADNNGKPATRVVVDRVVWSDGQDLSGKTIEVANLPTLGADEGYAGPGKYILALDGRKQVVPVPFPVNDGRIYPVTAQTEWQLDEIKRLRVP
jgi:hypothetical protein